MLPQLFYADYIDLPLPGNHRFPADKYQLTRRQLMAELKLSEENFSPSPLASKEDLLMVHAPDYVESVFTGTLDKRAQNKIGFPWSEGLVKRCQASTGGTYSAALGALRRHYGAQLAGGTHHAHNDFGAGYCVFNDFAVTIAKLRAQRLATRVAIIDLDVHHGDGNASLLTHAPEVFVFSMHGAKNYPSKKPASDLDIALEDNTGDEVFCEKLESALPRIEQFNADIILYQAGVDGLANDKLGRLSLTHEGLIRRDHIVFSFARNKSIPIVHVLGGGYSDLINSTIKAYVNTFKVAFKVFGFTSH